jgi:two-component system chemotaxis response regulator CheY
MFDLKSRILVVDDMLTMRKLVIKSCREIGFADFVEAKDGREAFEKLSEASPAIDLIISDWNMPNASGMDFLKRVRAESRFKDLPFVLVTAESEKEQVVEAISAGVTNYVVKPFTPQSLQEKLEQAHQKIASAA